MLPIIGVDYFFITSKGVQNPTELADDLRDTEQQGDDADATPATRVEDARRKGEIVKCIMVRCSLTKALFAHVIPHKGNDDHNTVADLVLKDVEWLGHSRVIFKSDGEPAMRALVKRVVEFAKIEVKPLEQVGQEHSAAYDSQSNGSTEVGIQLVRGLYRTLRLCLEERLNKVIPPTHAVTSWLLEHTALVYNAMIKGDDGLTAWGRVRGRSFRQQLVGFGESVLYRHPTKGPQHAPDGNMGALGAEGVFLGYNRSSNTFVVGTDDGRIVEPRSIARRPERQRWDIAKLSAVQVTPYASKENRPEHARVHLEDAAADAEARPPIAPESRPNMIRRMRINKADLDQYGYHESCAQCRYIQTYGKPLSGTQPQRSMQTATHGSDV